MNLPALLDSIASAATYNNLGSSRLYQSIEELSKYLIEYRHWLTDEMMLNASDEFAIGYENFENLLRLRGFEMNCDEILSFGEVALVNEKKKLDNLSKMINIKSSTEEIISNIKSNHPGTFKQALNLIEKTILESKKFVTDNNFAVIPQDEELIVTETPRYLKNTVPFAAYFSPAKFDNKKVGIYITTNNDSNNLNELNFASIYNTTVHEGYPGHHLQLTYNAFNHSLIRSLFQGTEFVEGWAHYCEEVMSELGWKKSLESQFMQTLDLIWRAARVIIDTKMSTGNMSFDEGVSFLIKETGMSYDCAVAEIKRYTYTPGYQLSYYLGKHLIKELKKDTMKIWNKEYSEIRFHNKILISGGLPIHLLRKYLLKS